MALNPATSPAARSSGDAGFTLVESLVALGLLAGALISIALVLTSGIRRLADSPVDLVAQQKAIEAVESVYTARDTRKLTWAQIRNVQGGSGHDGGIFLDGARPMAIPGPDGLVNTADDGGVETLVLPGRDGLLGTADDQVVPLSQFTREIQIRDAGTNLRQLTVTVTYRTGNGTRTYVLTTLISSWA
jgi:type II secretory pathway pseudopilin PulG